MGNNWKHISLALVISLSYIFVSSWYIGDEKYILLLLPLALLAFLFIFVKMDKALLLIVFLAPLSVPLREYFPGIGTDMYLPTEPLLVFLTVLFFIKIFLDKSYHKSIFTHPVTLTIYFSIFWILVTSATSSLPAVSFKFLASRIWFIVPFYFLLSILFKDKKNIKWFLGLYAAGLGFVIIYTINKHLGYGLNDQEASNWVCSPFYNDHTSYGAALAMILFGIVPMMRGQYNSTFLKRFAQISFGVIIFALVFSYSRAAWLSVVATLSVLGLVLLKIKFKWVFLIAVLTFGSGTFFYNDILFALEKNQQDSSGDFNKHISSITNITTDASNVERLNRWNSAIRLFKEKPVFGWGPGTYTFQYAPFQYSKEKTIISTNFGDGGNAHSEYLGPLAESGILGPIYFLLIGIFSLLTGFRVYHNAIDEEMKWLALFTTLGLITYLLHGFLNNFLDTDKLSVLFWGFIAILVSLDIKQKQQRSNKSA